MKELEKKDLAKLLDLDFSRYEYYADFVPYRYEIKGGDTEYFDRNDLKWLPSKIDIRAKYVTPFEFNVDEYDESHQDQFVDFVLEYINRGK